MYYAWLLMVKLNHFKKLGNRYRILQHVKAIPLYVWTGAQPSRRFRLPGLLDSRHMKVVSPMYQPPLPSWYSYLAEAESTAGHGAAGRIRSVKKANDPIENRTRDVLVCSLMPQPTAPPHTCLLHLLTRNHFALGLERFISTDEVSQKAEAFREPSISHLLVRNPVQDLG